MQINKQLFENILSGKLKGTFKLKNGFTVRSNRLFNSNSMNSYTYALKGFSTSFTESGKSSSAGYDIIDFTPESNMNEKELKIDIPEGYEIDKRNSTFERIVFKKKCAYPKSWEEFCENNETTNKEYFIGWDSQVMTSCIKNKDYDKDRNLCKTEEEAEAFLALIQLKRLWHEYVDNYSEKVDNYYYIDRFSSVDSCDFKVSEVCSRRKYLFKFPSRELALEFLNNFRDLFIEASSLWV